MAKEFELLKRTYPISEHERKCDGYDYILLNSSPEERLIWDVGELQEIIKEGEKYIYQVAKECGKFRIMCLSFKNYTIIRKNINRFNED